jgi:hypothetical protein
MRIMTKRAKRLRIEVWMAVAVVASSVGAACVYGAGDHPVLLGEGRTGKFSWDIQVFRDSGQRGGQRPCIGVGMSKVTSKVPPGRNFQQFSSVCSALKPLQAPNVVTESGGRGASKVTTVGMAFSSQVMKALVDFGRETKEIKLKLLNSAQAGSAGVRQIRYAAFASKGPFCIHQVTAYGESGEVLFKGPSLPCSEQ